MGYFDDIPASNDNQKKVKKPSDVVASTPAAPVLTAKSGGYFDDIPVSEDAQLVAEPDQPDMSWFEEALKQSTSEAPVYSETKQVQPILGEPETKKPRSISDFFNALQESQTDKSVGDMLKDAALMSTGPVGMMFAPTFQKAAQVPTSFFEESAKVVGDTLLKNNKDFPGVSYKEEDAQEVDLFGSLADLYSEKRLPSSARALDYLSGVQVPEEDQPILKEIAGSMLNPYEWITGGVLNKLIGKIGTLSKSVAPSVKQAIVEVVSEAAQELEENVPKILRKGVSEFIPENVPQKAFEEITPNRVGDLNLWFSQAKEEPYKKLSRPYVQPNVYIPDKPPVAATMDMDPFGKKSVSPIERFLIGTKTGRLNPALMSEAELMREAGGTTPATMSKFSATTDIPPSLPKDVPIQPPKTPEELLPFLSKMSEKDAFKYIDNMDIEELAKPLLKASWYPEPNDGLGLTPLKQALQETTPRPVLSKVENVPYPESYSAKATADGRKVKTITTKDAVKNPKHLKFAEDRVVAVESGKKTKSTETVELARKGSSATPSEQIPVYNPEKPPKIWNPLNSLKTELNKLGEEGKLLAEKIDNFFMSKDRMTGEAMANVKKALSFLTESELDQLTTALDSGTIPTGNVKKAYDIIRNEFNKVADISELLLPDFERRSNYFRHYLPKEVLEKLAKSDDYLSQQAAKLVKNGDFDTLMEAEAYLKELFRSEVKSMKVGALESKRIANLDGWIRDPRIVIPRYLEDSYRRLAQVSEFGLEKGTRNIPEQWAEIVAKIKTKYGVGDDSTIAALLEDASRALFNNYKDITAKSPIISAAMAFETLSKLTFASVSNIGQSANTATRTSFLKTMKAIFKVATNRGEAERLADMAGHYANSMADEIANVHGGGTLSSKISGKFLDKNGFSWTERTNRLISSVAGDIHLKDIVSRILKDNNNKYATSELKKLGLDPAKIIKDGFLKESDKLDSIYKIVKDTQFVNNINDLPVKYSSNQFFKMIFQFKSFAYKQQRFLIDNVAKEAKNLNFRPAANLALSVVTIGEMVGATKDTIYDTLDYMLGVNDGFERLNKRTSLGFLDPRRQFDNFMQIGGLGLAFQILESSEFGALSVVKSVFGPVVSDAIDIGTPAITAGFNTVKSAGELVTGNKSQALKEIGSAKDNLQRTVAAAAGTAPAIGTPLEKILKPKKKSKGEQGKQKTISRQKTIKRY